MGRDPRREDSAASTIAVEHGCRQRRDAVARQPPQHAGAGEPTAFAAALRQGRVRGPRTLMALHPRIEIDVEHVDQQVDGEERDREDHDRALRRREIAGDDGADREPADAGPGEHGLRHHGAAEQERRLQADQGDDRDQRIAQRVMHDHDGLAQALGARGAHEIGAQHFQHGGACQPRDRSDQHQAKRQRRQDQARQSAVPHRTGAAGERQQRPAEADILDQDQADEEHRHRDAGHRDRHDEAVGEAAAIDGGQRAERDPDGNGDQHSAHHQLDGRADGQRQLLDHLLVGNDRAAEIAAHHAHDVFEELHRDRTVEPELQPDRGDGFRLGVGACDHHRGIGRHHLQQAKTQEQHPDERGDRYQQTMDNLSCHSTPLTFRSKKTG